MKGICKILSVTLIAVSLQMPFSIYSYAVGYDFSELGDTDNQNFSGHNDVYTNGIYVGGSGTNIYFDTIMENSNNTYNGTSDIDNTAYPADSYDSRSTYNGTLNVTANDVLSSAGINYVNDATVNANTAVTVNDVLADNSLNAGVQFNDSSFNGDVTISGSGDVSFDGATVNNVSIGSTQEAQTIVTNTGNTVTVLANLYGQLAIPIVQTSSTYTFSLVGNSYTINLQPYQTGFAVGGYYSNTIGKFCAIVNSLNYHITNWYDVAYDNSNYKIITVNGFPVYIYSRPIYSYSYDATNDVITQSISERRYQTFFAMINSFFTSTVPSFLSAHIAYLADTWYRWYNPNISAANSQFWIAFNTDTEVYDHVNLSTVFGYITWYLGQLYIQGNEAASDISQSVTNLDTTLSTLEQKEAQINTQIKNSADDIDDFFNLPTIVNLGVILGWLQYMWVSLDIFQSVTYIGWALILLSIIAGFYKVKQGYV